MRVSRRLKLGLAAGAAVMWGAVAASPSYAVHQTVTGLNTNNEIVQFAAGTPGTLVSGPSAITFPAGVTDTDLIGIDYRPRGGNLMAQASQGSIYVLDPPAAFPGSWTATRVAAPNANPFTGATSFGFDFNPTVDRIRTVNDADGATNENDFRFNPNNGQQVDSDPMTGGVQADGDLAYAMDDANEGDVPSIVGAAYTNNFDGSTMTTLYDIDSDNDALVTQNPPNAGILNTVGPLGVDTGDAVGFDIETGTGTPYAALQPTGDASSTFYRLNLMTGAATSIGAIGPAGSTPIDSLSVIPIPVLRFSEAAVSVAEDGGTATITVVREGPLNRAATVNYATEIATGNTATSGDDFTASNGTLTFAQNDASESFTVPITSDGADEPNETFTVRLSAPSTSANLAMPPTTTVTIVDDDAAPGPLTALVSVPYQKEKKVRQNREVQYDYSCSVACTESSVLQLKDGTQLGTNSSSVGGPYGEDAYKTSQAIPLNNRALRKIKKAGNKNGVRVKLISTFADSDGNEQTLTTRFRIDR